MVRKLQDNLQEISLLSGAISAFGEEQVQSCQFTNSQRQNEQQEKQGKHLFSAVEGAAFGVSDGG